ncbi:MAG: helix-turn-helix domain-containing protein [Clostridia bacterium]|nr:helix-turn-helix domain-containing protein [Clostridia bacterium]
MQNVKSDNYINIQGWMISELGLKNTELLVYAIIYGFSQDGQGRFRGTLGYLMDWTQASKPTVIKALDGLQERGLIVKDEVPQLNGQRGVEYRAMPRTDGGDRRSDRGSECDSPCAKTEENPPESADDGGKEILPPVKKFDGGGKESLPGGLKNFTGGVKKFYPDHKDNNINNTIGDNQSINPSCTEEGAADGLMDRIRTQIEYDVLTSGDEFSAEDADAVVIIMAEVETSTRPTIRVGSEDKPREIVRSVFQQLKCDDVMNALRAMHGYSDYNEIYDPKALLRTYLYNAKFNTVGDICGGRYAFYGGRAK